MVSVIKWFASCIERLFFSVGLVHARICPFFSFVDRIVKHRKKRTRNFFHMFSNRFPKISVSQFQYLWVFRLPTRVIEFALRNPNHSELPLLQRAFSFFSTWRNDLKLNVLLIDCVISFEYQIIIDWLKSSWCTRWL